MAKASIFWDASVQAYRLKLSGDFKKIETVVDFLKKQIPHSDRNLDVKVDPNNPMRKDYTWTFTEKYFDGTVQFLQLVYGKSEVASVTRAQVEAAKQPKMPAMTYNGNPVAATCYEFMKAIPFEAAQKAYREAAMRCHPDRGGSMEQMAQINALWTKLEKELYGQ